MLLYTASLSQAISNTVLLIFVSKDILDTTVSLFLSSSVFSVIWVLPIVCSNFIAQVSNLYKSINILVINSILNSLLIVSMFYITTKDLYIIYLLISLRGLSEALNRNISITSIKRYINPVLHNQCFSFFDSAKTLGAFLGGVVLLYITENNSFIQILNINLINSIVVLVCYIVFKLYKLDKNNDITSKDMVQYSLFKCLQNILKNKLQLQNLYHILISTVFFFGFYQISRILIPSQFENNNYNHIALFQIAATIGLVTGALYTTMKITKKNTCMQQLGCIINCFIIGIISCVTNEFIALFLYFVFIFLYQSIYSISLSHILYNIPKIEIGYMITFINTSVTLLMITFMSISSLCVDLIGYSLTSIVISITCLFTLMLLWSYKHKPI
ncbi:MFS transporter [Candidatus Tisiphia endosymbiont of Micropterix aruncella]|uniref:MFS transporter n=1 Tax=Candidatus Tisiphia endosymbiont of Micropterix aruncella TaxID=3066271 RepID=UPI003AA9A8A6